MLNKKKTLWGAVAVGVSALTLVGGGTFAAWSDYDTITGNETEAGQLQLDLNSTGSINNVGGTAIAPSEFRTIDFMVASADLDGVPDADLSMLMENLADEENGCGGTNAEVAVDPNCANFADPGEFSSQGYIRVRYTDPAPLNLVTFANNSCAAPGGYLHSAGYAPASNNDDTVYPRLSGFAGNTYGLGTLADGQGVCVRVDIGLGDAATNLVQTDSSTFDLKFNLVQTP